MTLSSVNRNELLTEAENQVFDLIVVGGGVTGAGIALDATARGISTLLIEKGDFAQGTSSRSTKLIHGGLRYLKQLEIGLVREVGRERAIVHANAPNLVHPEKLLLPIVENGSLGKYSTQVGLWLYEKLAGVPKQERFQSLNKEQTLQTEPHLNENLVQGGALYHEYRTDDARLVITLLKTAAQQGAICLNYTEAVSFLYEDGKICGLDATDVISGQSHTFKSKTLVNASGPWCDELRAKDGPVGGKHLQLTKGVHIVFPREKFPLKQAAYFDDPSDERMVFAIPRYRTVYFGTTDTHYTGDLDNPLCEREDVDYLLQAVEHMFPGLELGVDDIESSWAGLRPLIHEEGKSPSELSRKDETFQSPSGLISIAGGKLTGYRKMAERVTDMVMTRLCAMDQREFMDCPTDELSLDGTDFGSYAEVNIFAERLYGEGKQVGLTPGQALELVHTYGKNSETILETAYALQPEIQDPRLRLLTAELHYSLAEEMVLKLSDFLVRRTGRLYFDRPSIDGTSAFLLKEIAATLDLTDAQIREQQTDFDQLLDQSLAFLKS